MAGGHGREYGPAARDHECVIIDEIYTIGQGKA